MTDEISAGSNRRRVVLIFAALAFGLAVASPVRAEEDAEFEAYRREKCALYDKAFHELLDLGGRDGVTEGFIKGNEEFIKAGCSNGADVCPQSTKDFVLANQLTLAAMGFGTASTFLPFICRVTPDTRNRPPVVVPMP